MKAEKKIETVEQNLKSLAIQIESLTKEQKQVLLDMLTKVE